MRRRHIKSGLVVGVLSCAITSAGCSALWFAVAEDMEDGELIDN